MGVAKLTPAFVFQPSAGYGFSSFQSSQPGNSQGDLFLSVAQVTAGFGLRTVRTAKRKVSVQVLGGLAWESVWSHAPTPDGFRDSDARLGYFARLGLRWGVTTLYVEQGFGFGRGDPAPDSLIAWDNRTQFGLAFMFRGS